MAQTNRMRPVSLGFVDLGGDTTPKSGVQYNLVSTASEAVGNLPFPQTEYKSLQIRLLNMYIEDLPDFRNQNEALLRLKAHTRTKDGNNSISANKEDLAFSLEFNVEDGSPAPGFLQRVVFRNLLVNQFLELEIDLIELDKDLSEAYGQVKTIVTDSGLDSIDATNSIPYLKVATKLFDGIVETYGKNPDDKVWSEMPSIDFVPGPGGAFLRSGIYVLYETHSIYGEQGRKKKLAQKMPLADLRYADNEIVHASDPNWPLANYLIFMLNVSAYNP